MSDRDVIVSLSIQDAEAVRAWQRSKQGIVQMEQELQKAKKATADLSGETKRLSRAQVDGQKELSRIGKEAYQNRRAWSQSIAELEKQNADRYRQGMAEAAAAQRAHDDAHAKRIREMDELRAASTKRAVVEERERLEKYKAGMAEAELAQRTHDEAHRRRIREAADAEAAEARRLALAEKERVDKYKRGMAEAAAAQRAHDDAHRRRIKESADAEAAEVRRVALAEKERVEKYKRGMAEAAAAQRAHDDAHLARIRETDVAQREATQQARADQEALLAPLNNVVASWVSIAAAIGTVHKGLGMVRSSIEEVRAAQAEVTFEIDEAMRKFAAQAGVSDLGREKAQEKLFAISKRQAVGMEVVEPTARQLVGSGFTLEQVTGEGGVTEKLLATQKAAAASEEQGEFDIKQMARGLTTFLLAQGGAETEAEQRRIPEEERATLLSTEKVDQILKDTFGLYQQTELDFDDLKEFSRSAAVMARHGMDLRTQLSLAALSRATIADAGDAATSLRNTVSRMSTASAHKEKVEALASIGLMPEDIDLQGETIDVALARLRDALGASRATGDAGKKLAETVLVKIFEERGAQGASYLIEQADQLAMMRRFAGAGDLRAAQEQVTAGPAAAKKRLETEIAQKRFGGEGAENELIALAIQAENPGWQGKLSANVFKATSWFLPQEVALRMAVEPGPEDEGKSTWAAYRDAAARVRQRVQEAENPAPPSADTGRPITPPAAPDEAAQLQARSEANRKLYGDRVRKAQAAAAEQEAKKTEAKRQKDYLEGEAKAAKEAIAEQKRQEGEGKKTQTEVSRAQQAVSSLQKKLDADNRRIQGIKAHMAHVDAVQALPRVKHQAGGSGTHIDNKVAGGRHGRRAERAEGSTSPRAATAREQLNQIEEQRRLRVQLEEAERKRDEDAQKLRDLQQQTNELLAAIAKNNGKLPRNFSPGQRPPANIGGN